MEAKPLKKDKRYRDAPRYPVIYAYEDDFKNSWRDIMKVALKDVSVRLEKELSSKSLKKAKDTKALNNSKENTIFNLLKQNLEDKDKYKKIGKKVNLAESSVEQIILKNMEKCFQ